VPRPVLSRIQHVPSVNPKPHHELSSSSNSKGNDARVLDNGRQSTPESDAPFQGLSVDVPD
jgi:hypothetical protein